MRRRRARSGRPSDCPRRGGTKDTGSAGAQKPRGAPSASGWDLGRNDHTDEVEQERPAELFRSISEYLRLCVN